MIKSISNWAQNTNLYPTTWVLHETDLKQRLSEVKNKRLDKRIPSKYKHSFKTSWIQSTVRTLKVAKKKFFHFL